MNKAALASALGPLHLAALVVLAVFVWLAPDGPFDWRFWCTVVLAIACAAALGGQMLGEARPWATPRWWMRLVPYVLYAGAWLASYQAHPSSAGVQELANQGAFLALIAAVAQLRRPSRLLAVILAIFCLVGLQVLGPTSLRIGIGRMTHYKSLDQWGGYPEIGMLMSLGATACLAIVFVTGRLALRVAAGVLALGLAATTPYMLSRSAMLTILVIVPWLAAVAATRLRSRLAIVTLGLVLAGLLVAGRSGPSIWTRLAAATHVKGGELDQRADGWRVASEMLRDHPWLGVGPGRYREEHARYSAGLDAAHAYNLVLHTGAELGLLGLLSYLTIWARLLVRTLRTVRQTSDGLVAFATHAMLLTFFVRSQSEHFLANLPTSFRMLLVLGFVAGLAEAVGASRPIDAARSQPDHARGMS